MEGPQALIRPGHRRRRLLWLLGIIVLVTTGGTLRSQQADTNVVARAGGTVITRQEFLQRFALSIFPLKDRPGMEGVARRQFLLSLIAEKLLAADARRSDLLREDTFERNRRIAEEMFVRDKLYRDLIRSRVHISESELRALFEERRKEVEFQFLWSASREEIGDLHRLLRSGVSFDSLLAARQAANTAPDTTQGTLERELLQTLARLAPGQVSAPVQAGGGFYLVRKVDRSNPIASEQDFLHARRGLENKLRAGREAALTREFVASLWKGTRAVLADRAYRITGEALLQHLRRQFHADTSDVLTLTPALDSLHALFGSRQAEAFATVGDDSIGIGDMLDRLAHRDHRVKRADVRRFPELFRAMIGDELDIWMVAREGYRRNLQTSAEVRRDVAMWADNGLAQAVPEVLWERFIASDDSVWSFYRQHLEDFGSPPEVRLRICCSEDSVGWRRILAQATGAGAGGDTLGGVPCESVDWFPVTERGEFGRAAFGLEAGERMAVHVGTRGGCVVELLGRRLPADTTVASMHALRQALETRFRSALSARMLHERTRRLASNTPIEINEAALQAVEITPAQMFTLRFLGFGGRIPAVPGVMPLFDAVLEGMSRRITVQP